MRLGKRKLGAAQCTLAACLALPEHMRTVIEITNMYTNAHHRGKGCADRLLTKICLEADEARTVLLLMPDSEHLQTWYGRHGFAVLQNDPVIMARSPHIALDS